MDGMPFLGARTWLALTALGLGVVGAPGLAAAQVVVTEFPVITSNSQPSGITAGPDGNLWFTEAAAGTIGRITPAGFVTEFPVLTAGSQPQSITTGPDGRLWFTEFLGNRIGRMSSTGFVVVEFPVLTPASGPAGITVGPDGNLWFTEFSANKIGRITPTGVITEFPVPTPDSQPASITAGPDGNLWFTELAANRIGRITPTGFITEFPVLTANSQPVGIAAGPDGNLWFTEAAGNMIGRITPAGTITEFPVLSPASVPFGITAGPGGALWFTEQDADRVGRLALPDVVLTVQKAGAGRGTVTSAPAGIACGATCAASFRPGTPVTLAATASPGSIFIGWSAPCTGLGPCTVTVGTATTVTATFRLPPADLVTATVNQPVFGIGDTIVGSITLKDPGLPITVDLFVGVVLPDGETIIFFTGGGGGTALGHRSAPTSFQPIAAGVSLAQPVTASLAPLFTHTWAAADPPGGYLLFFLAAPPGVFTPASFFGLATAPFTFAP